MKSILCFVFLVLPMSAIADPDYEVLAKIYSPKIDGDTLIIEGRIDSHIYNFIAYEANALKNIKYISLNSYGGNNDWALQIGYKIQQLQKITVLKKGNVCASACVYLFTAGKERFMEQDTWLGVHGARLMGSYAKNFYEFCVVDVEGQYTLMEYRIHCQNFLTTWYDVSFAATSKAFDLMEASGVLPTARDYYFSLENDPLWYQQLNVLKKPDWVIDTQEAAKYNFTTKTQ